MSDGEDVSTGAIAPTGGTSLRNGDIKATAGANDSIDGQGLELDTRKGESKTAHDGKTKGCHRLKLKAGRSLSPDSAKQALGSSRTTSSSQRGKMPDGVCRGEQEHRMMNLVGCQALSSWFHRRIDA